MSLDAITRQLFAPGQAEQEVWLPGRFQGGQHSEPHSVVGRFSALDPFDSLFILGAVIHLKIAYTVDRKEFAWEGRLARTGVCNIT